MTNPFDIDIVLPFVDCADPSWQDSYTRTMKGPNFNPVRYRDWGMVRYILRGVEKNMPWIRKVFFVVSSPSQVPSYINTDRVKVVYHQDFIPNGLLPLFSSCTLELFMHRIPGLSEHFIYFNDDIVPVRPSSPEDFFTEGNVRGSCFFKTGVDINNVFRHIQYNCTVESAKAAGQKMNIDESTILTSRHGVRAYLKSECEKCMEKEWINICGRITPVRSSVNLCQFLYYNYMYFDGRIVDDGRASTLDYVDFDNGITAGVRRMLESPEAQFICINDSGAVDGRDGFQKYKKIVVDSLERIFPEKCEFEK